VHPKQFLSQWYIWLKSCTYELAKLNYLQKVPNKILHDPRHLGVPMGASKMVSEAMVHLVHTVDLSCTETKTLYPIGLNEILHDPRHLGVLSGPSKMISEHTVHSAQTVHLSRIKVSIVSE
jgi:hypothetical protein